MEEISKENKIIFDEIIESVGLTLVKSMHILEIDNFIEANFSCGDDDYKLVFTKTKKL